MLTSEYCIMSTDEDQPIVEDVLSGFDDAFNFVINVVRTDYRNGHTRFKIAVTVAKEDAFNLSKSLGCHMTELPEAVGKQVAGRVGKPNPGFGDVRHCVSAIIDVLLDNDCRYSLTES